ncbi:hypothetical protein SmJEL517_g00843 [Synchytrium microbalum]|uniref:cutinase n=1 Tax=Synchytrium microbalum TaxID=1806994 RepID=A0A507CC18_9FUNG|nr:uncharacterized protein SmJEL517_g00843 [Synchytrium microbalum]TPX37041.1 hypothetical protein SmJEL517_g00843 [Synchytrium microbalum]
MILAQFVIVLVFISAAFGFPTQFTKRAANNVRNDARNAAGTCKDVMVICARGTTEAANMGSLACLPFTSALEASAATAGITVGVQGVNNYAASIQEYLTGGSKTGAAFMAQTAAMVMSNCPNTSTWISGYSQGGQVLHLALDMMTSAERSNIAGVVVFGDGTGKDGIATWPPEIDTANVLSKCTPGDKICEVPKSGQVTQFHLQYPKDAPEAAAFVMNGVQAKAQPVAPAKI